jgi:hypothetical protein
VHPPPDARHVGCAIPLTRASFRLNCPDSRPCTSSPPTSRGERHPAPRRAFLLLGGQLREHRGCAVGELRRSGEDLDDGAHTGHRNELDRRRRRSSSREAGRPGKPSRAPASGRWKSDGIACQLQRNESPYPCVDIRAPRPGRSITRDTRRAGNLRGVVGGTRQILTPERPQRASWRKRQPGNDAESARCG